MLPARVASAGKLGKADVDSLAAAAQSVGMRSLLTLALPIALLPLLSACGGSGGGKVQSASASTGKPITVRRVGNVRQPVRRHQPPPAQIQAVPGVEGVIGATPGDLTRQFGAARLDVWEGDARKLQFSGNACVLDVYLYPSAQGREPQATYVDARRSDGQDVDRAACIAALRKR